jgi:fatty acid desaturase
MIPEEPSTARLSLRSLTTEQAGQIRVLHRIRPIWNFVCILYPALWVLSVVVMERFPAWYVRLAGVAVIAISMQAMGILMHEALHRNLFRRRAPDRWAAFIFGVPAFFSGAAYKVAHLNHHRYTRTKFDQDEFSNFCRSDTQYLTLFYTWFVAGTFLYFFIVPWKALAIGGANDRRQILLEYGTMLGIYGFTIVSCLITGHASWLLWYWLIPAQIAMVFSNIRGLAEHQCTGQGSVVSRTRTTKSTRLVSFLMLNLNYHLEHHLFPGIPWYNLPKVHAILTPLYEECGAYIQGSYVSYARRAFVSGPFREIRGSHSSRKLVAL